MNMPRISVVAITMNIWLCLCSASSSLLRDSPHLRSIIQGSPLPDCLVYIAMGSTATFSIIDLSVHSARTTGLWTGEVYILTDAPECMDQLTSKMAAKVIQIGKVQAISQIKGIKAQIFSYLPLNVTTALYIDADIIVNGPIQNLFNDIQVPDDTWIGLFEDSASRLLRSCWGCDRWHTGVMLLNRRNSPFCLSKWRFYLLDGDYSSDQGAMDQMVQDQFECKAVIGLPKKHLSFVKDYLGLLHRGKDSTFLHMTSANRIEEQSAFYVYVLRIVIGWKNRGLHENLSKIKQCLVKTF